MSEWIKKDAVLSTIEAMFGYCTTYDLIEYKELMLKAVKVLPSADIPQEWIPCSERLPNDGDRVVVQYANGDLGVINSCRIRLWNIINSPYSTVVAWMPLPEPWKGADDECR